MAKWIIGIVVVVLVGAALWWSGWLTSGAPAPAAQQQATTTPQQSAAQQQQAIMQHNGMSPANDTSNAALSQDAAAIDAQMQGLTTDTANVNSSLNDQPVQQSY